MCEERGRGYLKTTHSHVHTLNPAHTLTHTHTHTRTRTRTHTHIHTHTSCGSGVSAAGVHCTRIQWYCHRVPRIRHRDQDGPASYCYSFREESCGCSRYLVCTHSAMHLQFYFHIPEYLLHLLLSLHSPYLLTPPPPPSLFPHLLLFFFRWYGLQHWHSSQCYLPRWCCRLN